MSAIARRLERIAALAAPTRWLYLRWYERRFVRASGFDRCFRGVYRDFAAAAAAAPTEKPLGYDNEPTASLLLGERHRIHDSDFPVMFWLSRLLQSRSRVFDLGGNVGISYYAYRPYLPVLEDVSWVVCEVPAVVRAAEAVLAAEPAPPLAFTTSFEPLAGADVLLAAGSLQFLESPLGFLRSTATLPRHVLINKTPLYAEPSALTIQATGSSYCPYHLFNRDEFFAQFAAHGYELVQSWENSTLGCHIPTFPAHSIRAFSGAYLRRR